MTKNLAAWLEKHDALISIGLVLLLAFPLSWLYRAARGSDLAVGLLELAAAAISLGGFFLFQNLIWRLIWRLRRD